MQSVVSEAMKHFAKFRPEAQPIFALSMWLQTSGRMRRWNLTEGDPEAVDATLWPPSELTEDAGGDRALCEFVIRPGPATGLNYWMAGLPKSALDCLATVGQDGEVPLSGFALWRPREDETLIVHVQTPGAYGAVIGKPNDFLRALSLPVRSLADILREHIITPARPNATYRAWLETVGLTPAETVADALPMLRPADDDPFRDWLRGLGYNETYFLDGILPKMPPWT